MSDETTEPTSEETNEETAEQPQKKKGVSVLMIIILAVIVWAVIFYFLTLRQSPQPQQNEAPPVSAPAQQVESQSLTQEKAMQEIMDLFGNDAK